MSEHFSISTAGSANATAYEGDLSSHQFKIAIITARFNSRVTSSLYDGCISALAEIGQANTESYWVPGAFEIPVTASRVIRAKKPDGVIALGAVIRGETAHFDFVAGECAKGISKVALDTGVPVIFGVVTTDTVEQALNRAGLKSGNKGAESAHGLVSLLNLYRKAEI